MFLLLQPYNMGSSVLGARGRPKDRHALRLRGMLLTGGLL